MLSALLDSEPLHELKLTLESHDEATLALDHLGNHVVNETVLVPDALGVKLLLVVLLKDLLEDVLEAAVVLLKDGVLGAHVQRQTLHDGNLETGVGEAPDGVIGVVLHLGNTTARVVEDFNALGLAVGGSVDQLELTRAGDDPVSGTVLVTVGVAADDDGLGPAGDETGDDRDDDGLTEYCAAAAMLSAFADSLVKWSDLQDVTNGSVGRNPHWNLSIL